MREDEDKDEGMRIHHHPPASAGKPPTLQIMVGVPLALIYLADANENLSVGFTVRGMPTSLETKKRYVKGVGVGGGGVTSMG